MDLLRRTLIIGAAFCVAVATGCTKKAGPAHGTTSSSTAAATDPVEDGAPSSATASYQAIGQRNMFRPLVHRAPAGDGGAAGEGAGAGSAASGGPGGGGAGGPRPSIPSAPPDPTADLALTGIIESTDGLRALIERISTREGEFVAAGEQVFGFLLKEIGPGTITLTRGRDSYALKLGEKEIGEVARPTPGSGGEPQGAGSPSPSTAGTPTPGRPPGFPDFSSMSPDQRRDAYRRWWDGMSEDQRDQFRSRRGGFGGGDGGGRGPGGDRMRIEVRGGR